MNKKLKIKKGNGGFNTLGNVYIGLWAVACLIPFWLLVSGSFTNESEFVKNGISLFPKLFSVEAYKSIFRNTSQIVNAYCVSIFITVFGTAISLFFTAMTGYALSRKGFALANKISFFLYFTTLFSGGLLPYYILLVRYLHMKNTVFALLVPGMFNVFNLLVMKSFAKSIPNEIYESGTIDGAGAFKIFIALYLPMLKPALATIGLMTALAYWNDWSKAMLYIDTENLYPLQYLLYKIASNANDFTLASDAGASQVNLPTQTVKLAMTVVSVGPLILVYPLIQKYFVEGLTIGAVKG